LSIASVGTPANGTAYISSGQITYTPNANFNGTDSFSYTVSDGNGGTDEATVTVTVNAVNDPPVAANDSASTNEDTAVSIDVCANDTDIDGDTLSIAISDLADNGITTIDSNEIIYTPDENFNGIDSFSYTVSDGNGGTDEATVTVTVNSVNDDPVASDDSASTNEDSPVTIDVLANDTDIDGDTLSITSVGTPANGTAAISAGRIQYTPDANFNGNDSFSYTVTDGNGGSDTARVTVSVSVVNDPPVAADDSISTMEDTAISIDVLANDTDPEGDTLNISGVGTPSHGSAVIDADSITYTPDADYNGSDSFSYTVSDGNGGTDTAAVTVTIESVNDPPVTGTDDVETYEDDMISIDVLANDSDPDGGILSLEGVTSPSNGTADINDSMINYTPNENYYGTDSFYYAVNDGQGRTSTGTVNITIISVNDPPIAGDDTVTMFENTTIAIDVLANDDDIEGDTLSIAGIADPDNGTATINNGMIEYTPDPGFYGTESFYYGVYDGQGSSTGTINVTVFMTGAGEVSVVPSDLTVTEGDNFSVEIHVNTGAQKIAAYGIYIGYNTEVLALDTSMGESGISEGPDGFIAAVNAKQPGLVRVSGFDTSGEGPGTDLHLLTVYWTAIGTGTSLIEITVDNLVDNNTHNIGERKGINGTATVLEKQVKPAGTTWVEPDYQSVMWTYVPFTTDIYVSTGTQLLADYEIEIAFDSEIIGPDTETGDNGVTVGTNGFITSVDASVPNVLIVSGYDAAGRGPGELHLLTITWLPNYMGTSPVIVNITKLSDETGADIGEPPIYYDEAIVEVY
jgi:predicted RNA-binding protein with EMAP domain